MKFRNFMLVILILLTGMLGDDSSYEKYDKLKLENCVSIKKEDLPEEFGGNAFKTVDEFVKKTFYLDYECLLYFDYVTGKILRCAIGNLDSVNITFADNEFDGCHVASIHNHPVNVFSPPSAKNFAILKRSFEDYELIASRDGLWIFKAKGVYGDLFYQMNILSDVFFNSSFEKCTNRCRDDDIIDKKVDSIYGRLLIKYINDKNINNIQLTKKELITINDLNTAEYTAYKRITDPHAIRLARERERDPNVLSGQDRIYFAYKAFGMEIDYDDIFPEFDD